MYFQKKNVNIVDNYNFLISDLQSPIQKSVHSSVDNQKEFCGIINASTEAALSEMMTTNFYVNTSFDYNGKELKKLLNLGFKKVNLVHMFIQVNSANQVSFLKKNITHELELRDSYLKILPVEQATKASTAALQTTP